jgi:hypothetical protein
MRIRKPRRRGRPPHCAGTIVMRCISLKRAVPWRMPFGQSSGTGIEAICLHRVRP